MLLELTVENVAIVERARLEFGPGLNVLTGETGAGKSVLIDAVAVLLGARASDDLIGSAGDRAVIAAVFDLSAAPAAQAAARDLGLLDEDQHELVVVRELARGGRNLTRINGRPATVANLKAVARHLVDLHGQHEHQSLLDLGQQRALVDAYGGSDLAALAAAVGAAYARLQGLRRQLDELAGDARQRARTIDLYRFQIEEIEAARLRPGEEEEIQAARRRIANAERIREALAAAYGLVHEGHGMGAPAADAVAQAADALRRAAAYDPGLEPVIGLLDTAAVHLEEAAQALRRRLDDQALDPAEAEAVERRAALLSELKRKYGDTVDEILAYRDRARAELERLEGAEERAAVLEAEIRRVEEELGRQAAALSEARERAGRELAAAVARELADLAMTAQVLVEVRQEEDPTGVDCGGRRLRVGPHGVDTVEILLSANPGEPPRPLQRVASGGELSRVMLALKRAAGRRDPVPTLIFDEIDAGIGGRTATAVADKLAAIAADHQVLCVTHLPQIAAVADRHFVVEKSAAGGRTVTRVAVVDGVEREREIARMLAGEEEAVDLAHARALLDRRGRRAGGAR
ncbi:MAG: DNA repair protein RecN [Bacillota bacterium]|nr:DNA repair protein RecN [Bacillota bacterium]